MKVNERILTVCCVKCVLMTLTTIHINAAQCSVVGQYLLWLCVFMWVYSLVLRPLVCQAVLIHLWINFHQWYVRDLSPCRKGNSRLTKLLGELNYEKSGGTIIYYLTLLQLAVALPALSVRKAKWKNLPNFSSFSWFSPSFSRYLAIFLLSRGAVCPPLTPQWLSHWWQDGCHNRFPL